MMVKSEVLAVILNMLSISLSYKVCISSWRYLCNPSLTLQELVPMTSVPPVFSEGDKHSASCKITAGHRHRQSHQNRGNGHKKPVPIHPSNSCLRADLQKSLNAAISLQTGSGTDRNTHSETSLTSIWQHNVSLHRVQTLKVQKCQF